MRGSDNGLRTQFLTASVRPVLRCNMAEEFNAFAEGVEPGGLRNKTQIKLLIEYLIEEIKEPITADLAVDVLTNGNLANYFESVQAVDELCENSNIEKTEAGFMILTQKGRVSLRQLENDLPLSVKEEALELAQKLLIKQNNEKNNSAKIEKCADGYSVICEIRQGDISLVKLEIYATDLENAEKIKQNFIENPAEVYGIITDKLLK